LRANWTTAENRHGMFNRHQNSVWITQRC